MRQRILAALLTITLAAAEGAYGVSPAPARCYKDGETVTIRGRTNPGLIVSYLEPSVSVCAWDPKSGKNVSVLRFMIVGDKPTPGTDVQVTGELRHSPVYPPQYVELHISKPRSATTAGSARTSTPPGGGERITGAFGIRFGADLRPYLEGHYSSLTRIVGGKEYLSLGRKLTYLVLRPPADMQQMFPNTRVDYLGIADDAGKAVELLLKVRIYPMCGQNTREVDAVLELLRTKYNITRPHKSGYVLSESYSDGENQIDLTCDRDELSVRYTSRLFNDYVAKLAADAEREKKDLKESLRKAM